MHNPKLYRVIVLLFALVLFTAGCGGDNENPNNQRQQGRLSQLLSPEPFSFVMAFFPLPDSDNLVPVTYNVNSTRDTVWVALEKTLAGPTSSFVDSVLPGGIKLADVYLNDGIVYLHLAGEIPLTLDQINTRALVTTINFCVNDQGYETPVKLELLYNNESLTPEPIEPFQANDYSSSSASPKAYVFYADDQGMYVVPAYVDLKDADTGNFYTKLIEAWLANPPKDSKLASPVPEGTKLLNCSLSNKNLVLDLSKEAIAYGGGSAIETMFVNSLMATLRPYYELNTVTILIEGQKIEYLPEGTSLSPGLTIEHSHKMINSAG